MKLFTQLTGLLATILLISSCEYSPEVYTLNEKITSDVFSVQDVTKQELIDGDLKAAEKTYVHNNLSFDVANSGNSSAYNVEVEVTVVTDKTNETTEILSLGELKSKEIRRMFVEEILLDEYFKEYYINVYWDEDDED